MVQDVKKVKRSTGRNLRIVFLISYIAIILVLLASIISAVVTRQDVLTQDLTLMIILMVGTFPVFLYLIISRFFLSYHNGVNKAFKIIFWIVIVTFILS